MARQLRTVAAGRYVTPFREGGSLPALLGAERAQIERHGDLWWRCPHEIAYALESRRSAPADRPGEGPPPGMASDGRRSGIARPSGLAAVLGSC